VEEGEGLGIEPGGAAADEAIQHREPAADLRRARGRGGVAGRGEGGEEVLGALARIGHEACGELEGEWLGAQGSGDLLQRLLLGGGRVAAEEPGGEECDCGLGGECAGAEAGGAGKLAREPGGDEKGAASEPREDGFDGEPGDLVIDAVEDDEEAAGAFIGEEPAADSLKAEGVPGDLVFDEGEGVAVGECGEFSFEVGAADGWEPKDEVESALVEEAPGGFDGEDGLAGAGGGGGELRGRFDEDDGVPGEGVAQFAQPALAAEELPAARREWKPGVAATNHDARAQRADEAGEVLGAGEGPVLAAFLDAAAVGGLEGAGVVVVGRERGDGRPGAGDEAEDFAVHGAGDIVFELRGGPARRAVGAVGRLGAEGEGGEMDDGVALANGDFQDAVERAVGCGKIGVLDGVRADLAEGGFDDVATGVEFPGRGGEEDFWAKHHEVECNE